jgi:hypothetical protein
VNGALKAGCTFHFNLASLETEKYLPPNSTVKKWRYKKRWGRPTQILSGREEALFSFIEYLDLIRSNAKGFTYRTAESTSNLSKSCQGKKLLGVIWQTATMRRNFELFGNFIGLDMMKQGISTLLWPYFAVRMYAEMSKIQILMCRLLPFHSI